MTGDHAVLDVPVAFLESPALAPGELEAYGQPVTSHQDAVHGAGLNLVCFSATLG